jgi:hypothetical protein
MIKIRNMNFSGVPLDQVPIADEYIRCNFTRQQPDMAGAQPIGWAFPRPAKFTRCNLTNVLPFPGSEVDEFTNTQVVELQVPEGQVDILTIDGVERSRRTRPLDRVHARRWNGSGYDYHAAPLEFEGK